MELLDIINEQVQIKEKENWKIKNDAEADWWIEVKQEELAQIQRLKMQIQAKIDFYKEKLEKVKKEEEQIIEQRDAKLAEYFNSIDIRQLQETKTLLKYKLPSGTLKLTKPQKTFNYDKAKLVEEAEKRNMNDFIKIRKEFNWSEFKKNLKIKGNTIVNKNTGEVVELDGLEVIEKPGEFKVEV